MSNGPLTRKKVTGTFTAVFEGDYIPADEVAGCLEGWIDSGLDDRDNLRSWIFVVTDVEEEEMEDEF